mgnify:CR=1 FL=1
MTVLVTGGAGGIGGAVCREFAAAGYKVAINYFKSEESANKIVDEILEAGGMAKAYKADVSQPAEVSKMVVDVMADLGHVDVLINNAAVAYQGLITDTTDVIYDRPMDVNMKISSGLPILSRGVSFDNSSISLSPCAEFMGVSTTPGEIQFTLIPEGPTSFASDFVKPRSAALDAL